MRQRFVRLLPALLLGLITVAAHLPADAATSRPTRPATGASGGTRAVPRANTPRPVASPRVATGRGTYGRGHGHGHGSYPHHGYYYGAYAWPYSSWYWGWGWWGWPAWGYYGYPRVYVVDRFDNAPATIETDVRPKKSAVVIDGRPVGQARDYNGSWDVLYVEPGEHVVELSYPGYQTLRLAIDVAPGFHFRIDERLNRGEGNDPRSVERVVRTPDSRPVEEPQAAPAPQGDSGLLRGLLRIRATPPDAAVYLDGEFLARADELGRLHGALSVARGEHTVEVVRPGFEPQRREVVVIGEPVKLEIDLRRRE